MTSSFIASRPWLVVVPYCLYGDLHGVLRACESQGVQLQYNEQLSYAQQLAAALGFVAKNRFVHLDVASKTT